NSRCFPPERVACVLVSGKRGRFLSYQNCASSCWRSRSTTTNLNPVGTPISASGHCDHQPCTVAPSVLASLKPCSVSGFLSLGLQGKTGTPLCASLSAASQGVECA